MSTVLLLLSRLRESGLRSLLGAPMQGMSERPPPTCVASALAPRPRFTLYDLSTLVAGAVLRSLPCLWYRLLG